jgi:outer membrane protein
MAARITKLPKMLSQLVTFLLVFDTPVFTQAAPTDGRAVTLDEAFYASLKTTENVKIQEWNAVDTSETVTQAQGVFFPTIAASAVYQRQAVPSGVTVLTPSTQPNLSTVRLTASQPLFRGLKDFAGLRAAKDLSQAQQNTVEQTKIQVYSNVGQAFYAVLATEQDYLDLKTQLEISEARAKEIAQRVRIGRSPDTDLLTVESQIEAIRAQIEADQLLIAQARENLRLATGLPGETRLLDPTELPKSIGDITSYLAKLNKRPDIVALSEQVTATEENVTIARGGHLPSVDLLGSYYPVRNAYPDGQNWDFSLILTIPIFQGGIVQSQVRQAAARRERADLALSLARRTADRDIRSAYQGVVNFLEQVKAQERSLKAANRSYEAQNHQYHLGRTTNLDVLQAQNSYLDAKRQLDRARYSSKAALTALHAAVAELPAETAGASRE